MSIQPDPRRNIVLLGRHAAAKAGLMERMALVAERERPRDPNEWGVMDVTPFNPGEPVGASDVLVHFPWRGAEIGCLMGPDVVEAQGEVDLALDMADGAILVLDGSQPFTLEDAALHTHCLRHQKPCLAFVNTPIGGIEDYMGFIGQMADRLDVDLLPLHLPAITNGDLEGVIDLIQMQAFFHYFHRIDAPPGPHRREMSVEELNAATQMRQHLVAAVADLDDVVLQQFLDETPVAAETLRSLTHRAIKERAALPLLTGADFPGYGIEHLLSAIVDHLPEPQVEGIQGESGFQARAYRVKHTSFGAYTLLRGFSGEASRDQNISAARRLVSTRLGKLVRFEDERILDLNCVKAGDLAAIADDLECRAGDLLTSSSDWMRPQSLNYYDPLLEVLYQAKSEEQMEALSSLFGRFEGHYPSFHLREFISEFQVRLRCAGEKQLADILSQLTDAERDALPEGVQSVVYREHLSSSVETEDRFKRQAGLNLFAYVKLQFEPGDQEGLIFGSRADNLPPYFVDAVEDGLRAGMQMRYRAGYPIHSLRATLIEGAEHAVDSRPLGFQIAARNALEKACEKVGTTMLEPIMRVQMIVPTEAQSQIIHDLSRRRASITDTKQGERETHVTAEVPLQELLGFGAAFAKLTEGAGECAQALSHYAPVPKALVNKIRQRQS